MGDRGRAESRGEKRPERERLGTYWNVDVIVCGGAIARGRLGVFGACLVVCVVCSVVLLCGVVVWSVDGLEEPVECEHGTSVTTIGLV